MENTCILKLIKLLVVDCFFERTAATEAVVARVEARVLAGVVRNMGSVASLLLLLN